MAKTICVRCDRTFLEQYEHCTHCGAYNVDYIPPASERGIIKVWWTCQKTVIMSIGWNVAVIITFLLSLHNIPGTWVRSIAFTLLVSVLVFPAIVYLSRKINPHYGRN